MAIESERITALVEALKLAAAGREEYAESPAPIEWREFMRGQAAAFRRAAQLIENSDIYELITAEVPSWRWPKWVDDRVMGRPSHQEVYLSESDSEGANLERF
jgi:gamma-glutamyltranspeptidase